MNLSRYVLTSICAFIFIFVFEWIFHGVYLKELYSQTASLWRSPDGMKEYFIWLVAGQLLFAFVLSFIFVKGYENKGKKEGLRFGLLIWLLFLPCLFVQYAVSPYPGELILKWSGGSLI